MRIAVQLSGWCYISIMCDNAAQLLVETVPFFFQIPGVLGETGYAVDFKLIFKWLEASEEIFSI